jgi:hypothetical protein
MDSNEDYDTPIPEVWELFLRLISDNDSEHKFLSKIVAKQISKIINNIKNIYEENQIVTIDPIQEVKKELEVSRLKFYYEDCFLRAFCKINNNFKNTLNITFETNRII